MSAPIIWIIIPMLLASVLYVFRRWERPIHIVALMTTMVLAFLAWQLPIGEPISLRLWPGMPTLQINDSLIILGRLLLIDSTSRPKLIFVYLALSLWFGGAYASQTNFLFIPLGLLAGALITAALSISPILYSTLLFETIALACIPILSPPGQPIRRGTIRFLAFQTMGMCFILLANWLLPTVEISSQDTELALRSAALLGMGVALIDAVFPFHTWVPMLAERAHPYATTFVFFLLPSTMAFIIVEHLAIYEQYSISPLFYDGIRIIGGFMILTGGVWSAFQNHLGRILGFAILMQIGVSFVVISLAQETAFDPLFLGILYAILLPQALALAVWALSLQTIRQGTDHLRFRQIQGIARKTPFAALGLILSNFSVAGLPVLGSFPISLILWTSLAGQSSSIVLLMLVGNAGLLISGLRTFAVMVMNPEAEGWQATESRLQRGLILVGCLFILAIGILPQIFLPPLINLAFIYSNPGP